MEMFGNRSVPQSGVVGYAQDYLSSRASGAEKTRALDVIGFEVHAELSGGPEVAYYLAVPTGQAVGIGERRPQQVPRHY
jgi:hypothetical protein